MGVSNFNTIDTTGTITQATAVDNSITTGTLTATTVNATTINTTSENETTVNVGSSGVAGDLNIFPTTALKGKLRVLASDNTGNTNVTITNAAHGQATVYTIPDVGAATGTFTNLEGTQTFTGAKTFTNSLLKLLGSSTGLTTFTSANAGASNFTITFPAITDTVVTQTSIGSVKSVRASASVTANGTITYANVTGLSQTVLVGTYAFRCVLPSTVASGTGGIKYAFNYTTTVLSALEATGIGYTASAVAVQHTTTTTTQTDLFTQAAIVIMTVIEGTMTVSTGGTIDVQVAQNTSNASNSIALLGGSFELTRIA